MVKVGLIKYSQFAAVNFYCHRTQTDRWPVNVKHRKQRESKLPSEFNS